MKKSVQWIKNRYVYSTLIAVVYVLVLHDTDIYTLIKRENRVAELEQEIEMRQQEITTMKENLAALQDLRSLEKYARENYLFKRNDEEIFIFSFE